MSSYSLHCKCARFASVCEESSFCRCKVRQLLCIMQLCVLLVDIVIFQETSKVNSNLIFCDNSDRMTTNSTNAIFLFVFNLYLKANSTMYIRVL